jgi:hypothetical protein
VCAHCHPEVCAKVISSELSGRKPDVAEVRVGSISVLRPRPMNVRVALDSGHQADIRERPFCAIFRIMQRSNCSLFDQSVGSLEEGL